MRPYRPNRHWIPAILVVILLSRCAVLPERGDTLCIWDFDTGYRNRRHGSYNAFQRSPSKARTHLVSSVHRGPSGRSLLIDYDRRGGYCGVWMHLYDSDLPPQSRTYLDVREFPYLSFWVRGMNGGEDVLVQMSDQRLDLLEDSRPAGRVSHYLGRRISTNWQEVVIPVRDFGIDVTRVAGITWLIPDPGRGAIYVDDIFFKKYPDSPVLFSSPAPVTRQARRKLRRAMWVWNTRRLLEDDRARVELLNFTADQHITDLYLQLITTCGPDSPPEAECTVETPELWGDLLELCHRRNLRIYALAGAPHYVLTAWHPRLLALASAVIRFNQQQRDAARRFDGLRFDNEPYQLLGYEAEPERYLLEWLEGMRKLRTFVKRAEPNLLLGADIPFWLDEISPRHGGRLKFMGRDQSAACHLLDLLDEVTVMDYRDTAGGLDGIIEHGKGEVEYASRTGKQVLLGIETFRYEPEILSFVTALTTHNFAALAHPGSGLEDLYRFHGFRLAVIRGDDKVFIGLAHPQDRTDNREGELLKALTELNQRIAALASPCAWSQAEAMAAIQAHPELEGFQEFRLNTSVETTVTGFRTTRRMPDKVTFAEESKAAIEQAFEEVSDSLGSQPGFAGFAIHYYETYRSLPSR